METIRVLKRFNDGNYAHTEIEVTRGNEDLSTTTAIQGLEKEIISAYKSGQGTEIPKQWEEVKKPVVKEPKKGAKLEEPKEEQAAEEPKEEPKQVVKESKKKKSEAASEPADGKKVTRTKKQNPALGYTRDKESHRKEFVDILFLWNKAWDKDKALVAIAKEVSQKMVGEPLYDENGDVLGSFIDKTIELMEA